MSEKVPGKTSRLPLVISVLALGLSAAAFYINYIREVYTVQLRVLEVGVVPMGTTAETFNKNSFKFSVAVSNGGNKEATILTASPAITCRHSAQWIIGGNFISEPSHRGVSLKPKESKVLEFSIVQPFPDGSGCKNLERERSVGVRMMTDSGGNVFDRIVSLGWLEYVENNETYPFLVRVGKRPNPVELLMNHVDPADYD